jgi:hypothetical protein
LFELGVDMNGGNNMGKALSSGFISGFIGSLCCVGPLVLILLGLSGVSGAIALSGDLTSYYRWTLFIPLASVFLLSSVYFYIKKKEGVCNLKMIKHHKAYVITTISFAVFVWIALLYVIVPTAFSLIT